MLLKQLLALRESATNLDAKFANGPAEYEYDEDWVGDNQDYIVDYISKKVKEVEDNPNSLRDNKWAIKNAVMALQGIGFELEDILGYIPDVFEDLGIQGYNDD